MEENNIAGFGYLREKIEFASKNVLPAILSVIIRKAVKEKIFRSQYLFEEYCRQQFEWAVQEKSASGE